VLRRAYERGANFFDTADSYGPHVDEELIAEALHPYPKDLVIATKGGLVRPRPGAWPEDGRPEHLKQAIDGSLKRLRLERIDRYQLHAPDPKVPLEDSLGTIVDAQKAGKIRHRRFQFRREELERGARWRRSSRQNRTASTSAVPRTC
jgi:aryl-alcohol dehydrogenase-like predicted oxidoreductase